MISRQIRAFRALLQTAKHEGVPYGTVIANIEEVIHEAYTQALKDNNQSVLDAWHAIPCKGDLPTPLELVAYLGELYEKEMMQ